MHRDLALPPPARQCGPEKIKSIKSGSLALWVLMRRDSSRWPVHENEINLRPRRLRLHSALVFATTPLYDEFNIVSEMAQTQINAKKQQGICHNLVVFIQAYLTDCPMIQQ